ncbi:GTP-binding protein [Advenella alkanexedens]|uniref:GTP-binding protein n=1 Tax=Advenella alkanexedens TaxID=1481665 RepID=A0ABS6NMT5_9BURK|nr:MULTISPECIES: GTP-binding protein [Advenella]MBV4396954.1 GTP-binding protein [Advenella alkanexedens]MDD3756646.1 GTP-binding protein [Advenella sp.]WKU20588.1 GTP-binding protein [Advenella alkanexedens]
MSQNNTDKQGIGVTVITGFLGSGKSHFIRQLLKQPDAGQMAVIVNEIGQVGLDHLIYRHLSAQIAVLEGGCLCCQLHADLSQTLRELFMLAMQKKIPAFRHVIIETSGLADPSSIVFTLKHDFFLNERFYNAGVLCVVDSCHAEQQQQANPEWLSQLLAADVVLLSKEDICPEKVPALKKRIELLVMGVPVLGKPELEEAEDFFGILADLKQLGKQKLAAFGVRWQTAVSASLKPALKPVASHTDVDVITLTLEQAVKRGRFITALDAIAEKYGAALLRMKAVVQFVGDNRFYHVHGVHQQRSAFEALDIAPQERGGITPCVVLIIKKGYWQEEDRVLLS